MSRPLPGQEAAATTITRLRHELHRHPELAGAEQWTARTMAAFLQDLHPARLLQGLGGTGLAACFAGAAEGPSVLVRAELDGLPIEEESELPYRSQTSGVAHLCGHDGHMAILAGLALQLAQEPPPRGKVWLLLQPAEETGAGARQVLADPAYSAIKPDWVFALHNLPGSPLGTVAVRRGTFACGSIGLIVHLRGRSSHAGYPELGLSPAPVLVRLITALEGLPAQVIGSNGGLAIATVIHARLGDVAFGTNPGKAVVMVTLRAEDGGTLQRLQCEAERLVNEVAIAHGIAAQLEWTDDFPVTVNHAPAVDLVCAAARATRLEVEELREPIRWSEDFGHFTRTRPGALFGLGSGTTQPPLHAASYDFPDELLPIGVQLLAALVTRCLNEEQHPDVDSR